MADRGRALRLLLVGGTRPEAIKLAPLLIAARERPALRLVTVATGQQTQAFDEALAEFGLCADERLAPVEYEPNPDVMVSRLVTALLPCLAGHAPDLVIVQGDTSSALAGAVAADELGLPVAHVEAGLRSGDLGSPFPEERNRIAIDALAALLFAPTQTAAAAAATGARGTVYLTGNTGIDALRLMLARLEPLAAPTGPRRILLTCHRRESFGAGIAGICAAVRRIADRGDVRILCPVHDNALAGDAVRGALSDHPAVTLTGRLPYRDLVAAMASAHLILTDSGGIQEEAPALGVPALVLRAVTERPEAVATGNLRVVGTDPDAIVAAATRLLNDPADHAAMARPAFPFGRGHAATAILDHIERHFRAREHGRALHFFRPGIMDGAPQGA